MLKKNIMPMVSVAALAANMPESVIGGVRNDANGAGDVEKLLRQVNDKVTELNDKVRPVAEDALKQAKKAGELNGELKQQADELLTNQKTLTDAQATLTEKLEQLETRNSDLAQQLAERRQGGGAAPKSFGAQVAENEDVIAFAKAGARGTCKVSMPVRQAITSVNPGGGGLIWSDRETEIVRDPMRQMTIRNLLSQGSTGTNLVEYARQVTRDNQAAPVSEGTEKPESNYAWEQADAPVRTIAHVTHMTRQALDDAGQLQAEIDNELRYGLMLKEEEQLLKGDGVGQNISGLITEATPYVAPFVLSGATLIDELRLALLQASLAEFPSDGIVLHPIEWAKIELTKDADNRYVFANPVNMSTPGLWGRNVVPTQSMTAGDFLTGAFMMAATIYDRLDPEVIFSSEHGTNFTKNMITARAEERLALAVKRPGALISGTFGA